MLFKTNKEYEKMALEQQKSDRPLTKQLAVIVKKRGIQKIAKESGLSITALYTVISGKSNPRLSTLEKVLKPINYQIVLKRNRQKKD